MKVLLVGGGSGGHITPLLAVARELRRRHPDAVISYVLEKGSQFDDLPRASKDLDTIHTVRTGKFRRYHGDSKLKRILDVPTNLKNLRDGFYVVAGYSQAKRLLKKLRPDAVFIKGSSVGVPVGKACKSLGIPYFTHDSDSVASLTNRLLAKDAVVHAVGLPLSFYSRDDEKLRYTGIPLSSQYKPVTTELKKKYRQVLDLPADSLVMTITGGSKGAQRLNKDFVPVAERLLEKFPDLYILHQTGSDKPLYDRLPEAIADRVRETAFTDKLAAFTGASDVVVSRAGATGIAEMAVQGKACVFVPGAQLTGGQQIKNAEYLAHHGAAVILDDQKTADTDDFTKTLAGLLESPAARRALELAIAKLAKTDAAAELTAIIEEIAEQSK